MFCSSLACRQEMPRRRIPHLMDCNDTYLVLFTQDSCLYLYNAVESGTPEKYPPFFFKKDLSYKFQNFSGSSRGPPGVLGVSGSSSHYNPSPGEYSNHNTPVYCY